jgi:GNAT acetyltransferase-like protein
MPSLAAQWKLYPVETLARFASAWDELAPSPIVSSVAVQTMLEHLGDGRQKLAVCEEQKPLAMAIVAPRSWRSWETWQPSQAPIGLWVQKPVPMHELLPGLIRALGCLSFGVLQQDPDISVRGGGTTDYVDTARIVVNGSFDEYWSQRGKLRTNLQSQRNKLQKAGIATRLELVDHPALIGSVVDDYASLESAGWKAHGGTALARENAQGRFYRALMERLAARAEALAFRYFFGDKLVACDMCVLREGTLIGLKTTYDESVRSLSPGLLMHQEIFRKLWGRLRRIEFYGRTTDWHLRWTRDVRTMYHVTAFRWNWLKAARSALPLIQSLTRVARDH